MTLYLVKASDHTFPVDADNENEAITLYRNNCRFNGVQPDTNATVSRATAFNYRTLQDMAKRADEAETQLALLRSLLSDIAEEG
jgi:hypothetical protein